MQQAAVSFGFSPLRADCRRPGSSGQPFGGTAEVFDQERNPVKGPALVRWRCICCPRAGAGHVFVQKHHGAQIRLRVAGGKACFHRVGGSDLPCRNGSCKSRGIGHVKTPGIRRARFRRSERHIRRIGSRLVWPPSQGWRRQALRQRHRSAHCRHGP